MNELLIKKLFFVKFNSLFYPSDFYLSVIAI